MMGTYRKKTGIGKAGNPASGQGGSGGNMATPTKTPPTRQAPQQVMNMKAPMGGSGQGAGGMQGGGQPSPQDLQKIFDIARQQGPQAVQQYVAQAHGPDAAAALAAHPAVQQTMAQMPGGVPSGSAPSGGAGAPSASGWGGSAGIASPAAGLNQAGPGAPPALAPRYQQMIAAGQDPAAVAARAAQFQAGQLPGQAPMGRLAQPGPVGGVPPIPGGMSGGGMGNSSFADPYAPPVANGGQAQPGQMQNAGTQIPGVQAPPGGAMTKPYQDPNDMRNMLAQRLRGAQPPQMGFNAGGQNYQG